MILRTPRAIAPFFYAGFDRRARVGDEMLAVSIGRAYVGIYPTSQGFEVSYGILNQNEAL
jgi:hypothetical protein